ncbi:MAG: DHH family phosphoesterase [Haloarculaceae archaeon]
MSPDVGVSEPVVRQVGDLVEAARSDPELAALVVGVAALVVLVGHFALRLYWQTPVDRLVRALGRVEEVVVLTHPNPDPDAMASALAVREIADVAGTDAVIQYSGEIRHEENRAMQTVLGLEMEHLSAGEGLAAEHVVLVDHNEPRGFAGAGGLTPYAVVDHHPGEGTGESFTDVRSEYGACAAIATEYLRDLGWRTGGAEGRPMPGDLATALLYGIQSDTTNFSRGCTDADFAAAAFLFPATNPEALDRIANPPVDAEVLDVKARAATNRRTDGPFVCSFVGPVSNVDALGQAADELLRLEGVTAVVVGGESDGTLHLSGRSRDDRVHMGECLRRVVSDIPMADAGGHPRMGGGQLSVGHLAGIGPSDGVSLDELRERVFASMAGRESLIPE